MDVDSPEMEDQAVIHHKEHKVHKDVIPAKSEIQKTRKIKQGLLRDVKETVS